MIRGCRSRPAARASTCRCCRPAISRSCPPTACPRRITIDTGDLIRLIDKTRFAISTEETRYYLNGLYLHTVVEDGAATLRAVATDGHRLALAEMPAPEGAAGAPGVIVPRKTIQEARRLLEDAGETIDLQVSRPEGPLRVRPRGPDLQGDRRLVPATTSGSSRATTSAS